RPRLSGLFSSTRQCLDPALVWRRQEISAPRHGKGKADCRRMEHGEMIEQFTQFDPATMLETDDDIAVFMADAFETGDTAYIAKALGLVARARDMSEIAPETGLSREQLYRSFSERGNPTLAAMRALGVDMTAKPHVTS